MKITDPIAKQTYTQSIIGGTNLMLLPDIMGAMTRLHFLSPDGKCQSFDHKGNGYARGEGQSRFPLKATIDPLTFAY